MMYALFEHGNYTIALDKVAGIVRYGNENTSGVSVRLVGGGFIERQFSSTGERDAFYEALKEALVKHQEEDL